MTQSFSTKHLCQFTFDWNAAPNTHRDSSKLKDIYGVTLHSLLSPDPLMCPSTELFTDVKQRKTVFALLKGGRIHSSILSLCWVEAAVFTDPTTCTAFRDGKWTHHHRLGANLLVGSPDLLSCWCNVLLMCCWQTNIVVICKPWLEILGCNGTSSAPACLCSGTSNDLSSRDWSCSFLVKHPSKCTFRPLRKLRETEKSNWKRSRCVLKFFGLWSDQKTMSGEPCPGRSSLPG